MNSKPPQSAYSIARLQQSLQHFALGKTLGVLFGLGLLLLLVRALSPHDYVFFIASQSALEVLSQVSAFGMIVVAQRYVPELRAKQRGRALHRLAAALSVARGAALIASCALLLLAIPFLAPGLGFEDWREPAQLFLLVVLFEGFARFQEVIFDSLLMQGVSQATLLLRAAIRLGAAAALHFFHADGLTLIAWIYIDALAGLTGSLVGGLLLWRHTRALAQSTPGDDTPPDYRRYRRFAWPSYVAASLYTASGPNVVKLIATRLLTVTELAAFGFAAALSAMLQRYLPMFLLIRMLRPLFVAARQREDYRVRLPFMTQLTFKLNAFVLAPMAAFVAVAGRPLAEILTAGKYPEAGGYLFAFMALLLAQALRAVVGMTSQAMEQVRAPMVGTFLGLAGLAVGLALSPHYGGYAFCCGLVLSELSFAAWVIRALVASGLRFNQLAHGYGYMLLAAVAAAAAAWGGLHAAPSWPVLVRLGLAGFSCGVAFLLVAYFFKAFTPDERDMLNRILKKKVFVW